MSTNRNRSTKPSRNRMPQYLLGAATAGAALTPQRSEAGTVAFSDSGSFTVSVSYSGSTIALPDGSSLSFGPSYGPVGTPGLGFGMSGTTGQWAYSQTYTSVLKQYPIPDVLAPSTLISTTSLRDTALAVVNGTPNGDFTTAFSSQYVGFKTEYGNYGYLEVSWDPTTQLFQWNGGAVETSGASLFTPSATPVPEATSQSGLLALFVTGAVHQLARRRSRASKAA